MARLVQNRASLFFLGLFLGLLIGGGALLLLIPIPSDPGTLATPSLPLIADSIPQPKPEKQVAPTQNPIDPGLTQIDSLLPEDTAAQDVPDSIEVLAYLEGLEVYWDTAYYNEDSLDDYRALQYEPDSLVRQFHRNVPEDIRTVAASPEVLTDVLLYRKQIPVMEEVRDSLGNISIREAADSPLEVSFWKSPLNYKGYRKGGKSLVLFGVYAVDSVRFVRNGPHLYMEVMEDRYLITETFDYKHLIEMSRKKTRIP
jgi:hypothetical protein